MHRFDPDVIAALAEGRLSGDEATELEQQIAEDPIAAAELEAQRVALSFLGSVEPPTLTAMERSALRDGVSGALGVTSPAAPQTTSPRRVPWGSLGIAAAALAGLVVLVPVTGLLSTGGDDGGFDLASEAPTTAAAAPAEEMAQLDSAADEEAVVGAVDTDDGFATSDAGTSDDIATFGSSTSILTTTTEAAEEAAPTTTTTKAPATASTAVASSTSSTSSPSTTSTTKSPNRDQLLRELETLRGDPAEVTAMSDPVDSSMECYAADAATREQSSSVRTFTYSVNSLTARVYFEDDAGAPGPFQIWRLYDCGDLGTVE